MAQHIATIQNVAARHIQRANGQGFDLWEVFDSNGGAWVVKPQLAEFARNLIGQTVTFVTRTEVKPGNNPGQQWTNYYADAIYPGQPGTQPQPGYQPTMPPGGAASPQAGQGAQQPSQSDQERTLSIYRQVAAKVAGEVCHGDMHVFWTMLPELMSWFRDGTRPRSIVESEQFAANTVRASGGQPPAYTEGASLTGSTAGPIQDDETIPF